MADGILAAVNENGNIDRFIDTKGGVHYIEPKRYEESVAKIDAAATKAKETVNSATEAVSECKAQTGACTQETARAKEIADTVESRITGIEGDIATLRDSVSQSEWAYLYGESGTAGTFVRYRRDGARCVLQWGATQGTSAYWVAGNIPEQMRPADGNVYVPGVCVSPNGFVENICAYCYVSASTGEVGLQVAMTTNRNVRNCGETSWFI